MAGKGQTARQVGGPEHGLACCRRVKITEEPRKADICVGELGIEIHGLPECGDSLVHQETVRQIHAFLVRAQSLEVGGEQFGLAAAKPIERGILNRVLDLYHGQCYRLWLNTYEIQSQKRRVAHTEGALCR